MRNALDQLLKDQETKGGGLQYLRIGDCVLMTVLDLAPTGYFLRLHTLYLHNLGWMTGFVDALESVLLQGGLANLEVLDLSQNRHLDNSSMNRILGALEQRRCPKLRHLNLSGTIQCEPGSPIVPLGFSVAHTLASGALSNLEYLGLSCTNLGQGGMSALATALQGGACRQLKRLHVSKCDLQEADGLTLAYAIFGGNCTNLEDLELGDNPHMGEYGKCFELPSF